MNKTFFKSVVIIIFFLLNNALFAQDKTQNETSLQKLIDGNKRFVSGKLTYPNQSFNRLTEVYESQHPFAVIVSCSDSRVPPEIIFDQGIGDLFVIRLAGNVVDSLAIGSIEYAVEHLGTELIMVLGHENCGAVTASLKGGTQDNHIHKIVTEISKSFRSNEAGKDLSVEDAVIDNVRKVIVTLKSSEPILKENFEDKNLTITGGYYNMKTGTVVFLD